MFPMQTSSFAKRVQSRSIPSEVVSNLQKAMRDAISTGNVDALLELDERATALLDNSHFGADGYEAVEKGLKRIRIQRNELRIREVAASIAGARFVLQPDNPKKNWGQVWRYKRELPELYARLGDVPDDMARLISETSHKKTRQQWRDELFDLINKLDAAYEWALQELPRTSLTVQTTKVAHELEEALARAEEMPSRREVSEAIVKSEGELKLFRKHIDSSVFVNGRVLDTPTFRKQCEERLAACRKRLVTMKMVAVSGEDQQYMKSLITRCAASIENGNIGVAESVLEMVILPRWQDALDQHFGGDFEKAKAFLAESRTKIRTIEAERENRRAHADAERERRKNDRRFQQSASNKKGEKKNKKGNK